MGIDDDIQQIREKITRLSRDMELAQAELRGLERARKYITASAPHPTIRVGHVAFVPPAPSAPAPHRGGRQPGAISTRWKKVLAALMDAHFDDGAVVATIWAKESRKIKPTEVRRQFEGYIEQGLLERLDKGMYRITPEAVEKLRLNEFKTPDDGSEHVELEEKGIFG